MRWPLEERPSRGPVRLRPREPATPGPPPRGASPSFRSPASVSARRGSGGVDGDRSAALLSLGLAGGLTLVLAWAATDWLFRREAHRLLETLRARTSNAPRGHARRRPIAPR